MSCYKQGEIPVCQYVHLWASLRVKMAGLRGLGASPRSVRVIQVGPRAGLRVQRATLGTNDC